MLLMGTMMAAASTVDLLTTTLLPITARHFTDNLILIGLLVAMNRICGFLIQPYAAWRSERGGAAAGPRRRYLLRAWPVVFGSVALLGLLPFLIPEHRHATALAVLALFAVNLVLQASVDLCYGTGDPLYGDTFDRGDLGRANGIRMVLTAAAGVLMTQLFIPLGDRHEFWPFAGTLLLVALAALAAKSLPRLGHPRPVAAGERYRPFAPLGLLRDGALRRKAVCASAVLGVLALTEMMHALFVTETLGFSLAVLGTTTTVASAVSLLMPYPVG